MEMVEREAGHDEITTERPWPGALGLLITSALAVLVAGLLLVDAAFAAPPRPGAPGSRGRALGKISDDLYDAAQAPVTSLAVIIQTNGDPGDADLQRFKAHGADVQTKHVAIHGVTANVPVADLDDLADDPDVERLSLDLPVRAQLDVAVRAAGGGMLLEPASVYDGRGVGIALIDTGIQLHPDLDRAKNPDAPVEVDVIARDRGFVDTYGHGTHVAGILNGSGLLSSGPDAFRTFRGVAPGARLIALRALRPDGTGATSDVLRSMDWVLLHRREYNIRVLNLSLGHPVTESFATDPLCRAVRAAVRVGITVVVAAGNQGTLGTGFGTVLSPANEPSAVTVGAMDDNRTVARGDDVLAPFSAKGPTLIDHIVKPDLVAPGAFIVSLRAPGSQLDVTHHDLVLPAGTYRTDGDHLRDGDYFQLSGTSLAAPMVAGTAAVMIQKDPSLTPAQVKTRLMASAVKDDRLAFETGAGGLDIAGALLSTASAGSALSPQAVVAADGSITIVPLEGSWDDSWQQGLIWGSGRVTGFALQTENAAVSTDGMIWGGSGARLYDTGVDSLAMIWGGGH